jgi:putative peptidoglycan lipid II flippase
LTLDFKGTGEHLRAMLKVMLPMVVGLGVFQINTLLDGLIAYSLAHPENQPDATWSAAGRELSYPLEPGAVTTLTLAQRLYQFPLGVFGIAIATAIFPALAGAWKGKNSEDRTEEIGGDSFDAVLRRGLRLTVFIGLPASVGLVLVREPLTRVFFQHGEFTYDDAMRSAAVLAGYGSAVWAYSLTHVVTRGFYAADDAKTPLKISLAMVVLNFALNLVLIWPLGVAGLAWSTATTASLQAILLIMLIRKHVDQPIDRVVIFSWGRAVLISTVMGAVLWFVAGWIDIDTASKSRLIVYLALLVAVGLAVYGSGAWLTKSPEMGWLKRRR